VKVLVSGGAGFIGRALCAYLLARKLNVRALGRATMADAGGAPLTLAGPLEARPDLEASLRDVDVVVHLAGRAHMMRETAADALAAYRRVNVEGSVHLARAAARARVKRFVFVSSVKAQGDTSPGRPLREDDPPRSDRDPYGVSKWEAEENLRRLAQETGMELVVVRPPLVYGPRVRANFLSLIRAVDRGLPLPFDAVTNRRSLLYVTNLASAIHECLTRSEASGQTFFVADSDVLSTPQLVRAMAKALDRTPRLIPVPVRALELVGRALGRAAVVERLTGSLELDTSNISERLAWLPPFTLREGMADTAEWYRSLEP